MRGSIRASPAAGGEAGGMREILARYIKNPAAALGLVLLLAIWSRGLAASFLEA